MGWGTNYTWKVVYLPVHHAPCLRLPQVALVEACTEHEAMSNFQQQYAGQYITIQSCKKLLG